jgi:hypothetical protein
MAREIVSCFNTLFVPISDAAGFATEKSMFTPRGLGAKAPNVTGLGEYSGLIEPISGGKRNARE